MVGAAAVCLRRQVERLSEQLEALPTEAAALLAQRALEGHRVAVRDELRRRDASHDHIVNPFPRVEVGAREQWNLSHSDLSRRQWEHAARGGACHGARGQRAQTRMEG
eukprot:scaffold122361_cov57-Phaeocystis_antarctica.AAC.2